MTERKAPTCSLCSGKLRREQDVLLSSGMLEGLCYLAWVCVDCSAAFPIATRRGLGTLPLFEAGRYTKPGKPAKRKPKAPPSGADS